MAAKTRPAIGGVVAELTAEFAGYETELEQLREQRDTVTAAPRPLAEAAEDIPKVVDALAKQVELPIFRLANDPQRGWGSLVTSLHQTFPPPAAALLARVSPAAATEWLERELAGAYEKLPQPMVPAQRDQRLAELDREIAAVERRWAEAWWQAIGAGVTLNPPSGISGEALLGLPDA